MMRCGIVAVSAIFTANLCLAQDVIGSWVGAANNGGPLGQLKRITVMLSKDHHGELTGMAYGGVNEGVAFACTSVSWNGSTLSFTIKGAPLAGPMSFVGTLSDDGNSIEGWLESERLKLERIGRPPNPRAKPEKVDAPLPPVAAEPSAVLSRALEKLAGTGRRLLQYTCLETVQRKYYSEKRTPGAGPMTEAPTGSSGRCGFDRDGHLTLEMEDRLRLDVAVSGGKEIHSWAGAKGFDSRSIYQMVPSGPRSTGTFGTFLVDIFENPGAHYTFAGRKSDGSRAVFEYAFEVSLESSHYSVEAGNEWRKTAFQGSFEIDPATAELVRVSLETAELPADTQMCRIRIVTDYHYAPIGNEQFLIPRQSELDTVSRDASETRSFTTFTACHEYSSESKLVLDGEAPEAAVKTAPKTAAPLPPGLSLTLALAGPIDVGSAAAGDAVSARVTKAVRAPGSNRIVVIAGAIARGRIVDMQRRYSPAQFQYSIRYETLEQNGVVTPLTIRLEHEAHLEKARARDGFASRGAALSLPPVGATNETGSWFAVPAASGGYVVPEGFESKWVTAAR